MTEPRKTPRTDASVAEATNLADRDDVISSITDDMQALEIETQELAEAMQLAIDYAAGRETEWGDRAVQSFDILESALAHHRAKQGGAA